MLKPILILQMQRMGDLILSFPLLALLQRTYPENPLWTVAEECFFSKLHHLAPKTVFFPPRAAEKLKTQSYKMVINLSHREDAIALAGEVDAEQRFGFYKQKKHLYIGGNWPLYRASIVHNNTYNLFHWSDLYFMEYFKGPVPPWSMALPNIAKENLIGIFVGASEKEKRPSAQFFASLARSLTQKGYRTFFLGGPDDVAIGHEAMQLSQLRGASLCGQFSLEQLTVILQKMRLLITPDTGPMHLAAWVNTPILNLSLGPVNPWETGPRGMNKKNARHIIVQPAISCNACWKSCLQPKRCAAYLHPERIALLAHMLLDSSPSSSTTPCITTYELQQKLSRIELPHLHIYAADNDSQGLYDLIPLKKLSDDQHKRLLLGKFWKKWFWTHLHTLSDNMLPTQALEELVNLHPHTGHVLRHGVIRLGQELRSHLKNSLRGKGDKALPQNFWQQFPQVLHPLSGYMQLYLQNKEYSLQGWEQSFDTLEQLYKIV